MRRTVQLQVDAAVYETPIERYAREGKLMAGCLHGAKYQMVKGKKKVMARDAANNPILLMSCGKVCEPNSKYCPKHEAQRNYKEAQKPSGVR